MNKTSGQDPLQDHVAMLTEFQKVQMNKNVSELRLKDSKKHVEEMEKMLHLLEEVQITKIYGDQKLQKTEDDVFILNKNIRTLEKMLQEHHTQCSVEEHCRHYRYEKATDETERLLHTYIFNKGCEEHQNTDTLVNKEEGVVTLIDCSDQEMAVLSDKLSSLKGSPVGLIKLELLRKLVEKQLQHDAEVTELKKTMSSIEKKMCCEHQQYVQDMNILKERLVVTMEQLHRAEEENTRLHAVLELRTQEGKTSQELWAKKNVESDQVEVDHYKSSLAAVEHDKRKLQASAAEHGHCVQEEILAKQQLSIKLEKQGMQLHSLTEEHKELQLLYSCMNKEKEGVVLQLQSHLKNVQIELDQAKSTLRTLEQKSSHGLQVAQSMQKEITVRRQQIDSLQSKIQKLEETKETLCQEKLYQNFENEHQFHELALVQTEKKHLAKELEVVKLRDNYLNERISKLEVVLHKMSASFAGFQNFVQQQEQEYYRLKLNHILELKEDSPSSDLRSLLFKEQHGVKKHRPLTTTAAGSVCRSGSAPKRARSTALSTDKTEVLGSTQLRRKPSRSKLHHLKTPKLKETVHHKLFSKEPFTSALTSPQLLSRRSPVHMLLTSDPNS